MADLNLREIHDFLVATARKASEMILEASSNPVRAGTGEKKNSADLVTETDQAVEKMVSTALRERYPNFEFMGEETYQPGDRLSDTPTFICDPIDGTTNFFHGHPYVCVSLGLAVAKKPVVGVVLNPFTRTLYTGIRGQGSYVTSPRYPSPTKLPLRQPEEFEGLDRCLVAVEWGSERAGNDFEVKCNTFRRLTGEKARGGAMVHGIRSFGSAELNLCGVAEGGLDLYWEAGCWAWDVCAGWVILEEAGGHVLGCHQGDWQPEVEQRRYMGIRAGKGWEGIAKEFWGCVEGRVEIGWDNVSS